MTASKNLQTKPNPSLRSGFDFDLDFKILKGYQKRGSVAKFENQTRPL